MKGRFFFFCIFLSISLHSFAGEKPWHVLVWDAPTDIEQPLFKDILDQEEMERSGLNQIDHKDFDSIRDKMPQDSLFYRFSWALKDYRSKLRPKEEDMSIVFIQKMKDICEREGMSYDLAVKDLRTASHGHSVLSLASHGFSQRNRFLYYSNSSILYNLDLPAPKQSYPKNISGLSKAIKDRFFNHLYEQGITFHPGLREVSRIIRHSNVAIVNMSFGFNQAGEQEFGRSLGDARKVISEIRESLRKFYKAHPDVVFVVSASNEPEDLACFECTSQVDLPNVVVATAMDDAGKVLTSYSSEKILYAAKGKGLSVPAFKVPDEITINSDASTSFAAPVVTGLLAQLKEKNPNLTAQQLVEKLDRLADLSIDGSFTKVKPRFRKLISIPGKPEHSCKTALMEWFFNGGR